MTNWQRMKYPPPPARVLTLEAGTYTVEHLWGEWAPSETGSPLSFRYGYRVTFPDGSTEEFTADSKTDGEAVTRARLERVWRTAPPCHCGIRACNERNARLLEPAS